ncbi:MAG: maleylacetate reductase [Parvibaculum sp.]|uniref:maleylacetate reductase n=1 Tax=Alphaproteobacteria TaxID=28211 RepID=UPI003299A1B4
MSNTVPRARFGRGIRHEAGTELAALNVGRPLVLATPGQADMALEIAADLGECAAGIFTMAAMHTPVAVTQEALAHARSVGADSLVAVGGGSTIGLAKALALRADFPQVAIPTTYAGSEATPILGQTEDGVKTTLIDKKVLPEIILYDPELVVSLPQQMTVSSSLNAVAHAAEALYARERTAASTETALVGLQAFFTGLPNVIADLSDLDARERTLRGAWACGTVLGQVGMALHHKLCHTVGGSFDLPHADVHAVILPHAIHYNSAVVPDLLAPLASLLDGRDPGRALWEFGKRMKAPLALRDLGMEESQINHAVEISMRNPYWNPREVTAEGLTAILRNAWAGNPPGV